MHGFCRRRPSLEPVLQKLATSDRITIVVEHLQNGNMRVTSNSWDHERVLNYDQWDGDRWFLRSGGSKSATSRADCMLQGRNAGGPTGPPAAPARATTSSPIDATCRLPLATHRLTPATHRPSMCNGLHVAMRMRSARPISRPGREKIESAAPPALASHGYFLHLQCAPDVRRAARRPI